MGSATRSSRSTLPSRMWMMRWACIAISCSWVTSTIVLPLLVQAREQGHDLVAGGGVERSGGFVGQQDRGLIHQRARHGHALALASGELARACAFMRSLEIHLAHGHLGALDALLGGDAGVDQRQLHVVQRRGPRQQIEGLEDEADLRLRMRASSSSSMSLTSFPFR